MQIIYFSNSGSIKSQSRLMFAEKAKPHSLPWMVGIISNQRREETREYYRYYSGMIQGSLLCTGVLIAPTCVLTAGHCLMDDLDKNSKGKIEVTRVVLGEVDIMKPNPARQIVQIKAKHRYPGRNYRVLNLQQIPDLGLILLEKQPLLNEEVNTIRLAGSEEDCSKEPKYQNKMVMAGWGKIETGEKLKQLLLK